MAAPDVAGTEESERLALIVEVSGRLLAAESVHDVIEAVLELARRGLAADAYALWRYVPERGRWVVDATAGLSAAYRRAAVEVVRASPSASGIDAPFVVEDVATTPLLSDAHRAAHEAEGTRAFLAIPLRTRETVTGTLVFYYRAPRGFTEADVRTATALANVASSAIESARLREEREQALVAAETARTRLAVLAETSAALASSLDYEETLANVAALVVPEYADWVAIDILDDDDRIRRIALVHRDAAKAEWAERSKRLYAPTIDEPEGSGAAIRTAESLLYRDVPDSLISESTVDEQHAQILRELGLVSAMVVPLVARGRTLGALQFASADPDRRYDEDDLEFARHIARRAAAGVDNALLYRQAEEAWRSQRESFALLDTLFATAPVGLAFFDRDLRYARVNEALAEANGLPAEEHVGRTIDEVLPDIHPQVVADFRRVMETGRPVLGVEISGETPAEPGRRRYWESSFYPVRAADGEVLGLGAVVTEVTERRRLEVAQRFLAEASAVLASSLDVETTLAQVTALATVELADSCRIYMVDPSGRLERVAAAHANPASLELSDEIDARWPLPPGALGASRVLATGESELGVFDDETLRAIAGDDEHLARLRERGLRSFVSVPLTVRGETIGAISLVTAESGRVFQAEDLEVAEELARRASIAIDNARLYREAEQRAQAAQALEFVADAVFLLDEADVVRLWNPAAEATTGLAAVDVVGRPLREVLAGWEELASRIPIAAGPGGEGGRAETLPVEIDGRERWFSISGVRFEGGTVYAFRDLTEERALERLKSDFVSTVSHELRTPLAAIYGAALTLRRGDVRLDESQRTGMLEVISGEADRLARIVNDILWASRLDSGTMSVSIESCDPLELARQVVDATAAYAPPGIELSLKTADGAAPVAADADKTRQVLTNLLDNAIKYSPDGGRVALTVSRDGNRICFAVSDEGLGIPYAEQERIFEKFYRLDPNLTRGVGGTGLGLYICRELVNRMDGRIWVRSTEGRGSTFTVELPAA